MNEQIDDEDDLPVGVLRALILRQIQAHRAASAENALLARVNKKIGAESVKPWTDEVIRLEKVIEALKAELKGLDGSAE